MVNTQGDWSRAEGAVNEFIAAIRQGDNIHTQVDKMLSFMSEASGHSVRRLKEEHCDTLNDIQTALRRNDINTAVDLAEGIQELVRSGRTTYPNNGMER